ncbi:hypothetical protein [Halocalculus aciditolerans]|uniref:Uncharacterized protein n=1 Tax=Halocalculus aciditolerans TaxID=1383812 RepID=A0A830FB46_9EURY|nr:hypothetical protein [Halocalculus aciditolerans]GGL57559.1 hypothetical protein GCM10009039_14640 [Halocalculus aciditolerans]
MTDGEVSIRENGQVTVLETDAVDAPIRVELDTDVPEVFVPADTRVSYTGDAEVATDGGEFASGRARVIQSRGWTLDEDVANILGLASIVAVASGGYLWGGTSQLLAGVLLVVLGAGAAYVAARSKWSGTREVEPDGE